MRYVRMTIIGVIFFLLFTSVLAFLSVLFPRAITSSATPADYDLAYEDVQIETADGLNLAAWLVNRRDQAETSGDKVIILTHGYPADKGDILSLTEFLADDYDLLYFDFRGLGASEGRYSSVGIHERRDLQAAITWLEEQEYEEIGLWGFSVGGATALMQAPESESVKAVVSISAYARLSDLTGQLFLIPYVDGLLSELVRGYAYLAFREDIREVAPEQSITGYDRPIFIIHPEDDQVIPVQHGRQLKTAVADNPDASTWFPAGGHGFFDPAEHEQRVQEFFSHNF